MKNILFIIYLFLTISNLHSQNPFHNPNSRFTIQVNGHIYQCQRYGNSLDVMTQYTGQETPSYNGRLIDDTYSDGINPCTGIYNLEGEARKLVTQIIRSKFSTSRLAQIIATGEKQFRMSFSVDITGKIKFISFHFIIANTSILPEEVYAIEQALVGLQVPCTLQEMCTSGNGYFGGWERIYLKENP
jgi:hypothetical protein